MFIGWSGSSTGSYAAGTREPTPTFGHPSHIRSDGEWWDRKCSSGGPEAARARTLHARTNPHI
eukprot:7880644-Pyramimonas_sp.AAC.1